MLKRLNREMSSEEKERRRKKQVEYLFMNILAVDVGMIGGIGAVVFRYMISFMHNMFFMGEISTNYNAYSYITTNFGWLIFLAPAIGGLIVGLLIKYGAPEVKGHGVPEVMAAMLKEGGRIRSRVGIIKVLASSITIGSGGSAGREGPIIQIGSSGGSALGQFLGLSDRKIKTLVGCGAAAGIAATFNAPIAGVIFAVELILLEFKTRSFVPLVISSVTATIVARAFLGASATFHLEHMYELRSSYEFIFYLILGVLAGLAAVFFNKFFYKVDDVFERMRIPSYTKPMLGGLFLGVIGVFIYKFFKPSHFYIFGVGYGSLTPIIGSSGAVPLSLKLALFLLLLMFLKMIATSLTLGSGASGGVFAPSLWMGAMLGGAFGIVVNIAFPNITAPFAAYAIVGMAAFFSGASRATLTAIVIIFEMTSDYNIILPLMFACVVSDAVSVTLSKETIYTEKISRKGIRYSYDREVNILETVFARDVMETSVEMIPDNMPLKEVLHRIVETGYVGFPCVDVDGRLVAIITHSDITRAFNDGISLDSPVSTIKKDKELVVAYPDDTIETVAEKMASSGYGYIPVVDRNEPTRFLGFLTRDDVIEVFMEKGREELDWLDSHFSFLKKPLRRK